MLIGIDILDIHNQISLLNFIKLNDNPSQQTLDRYCRNRSFSLIKLNNTDIKVILSYN
jgi:hypothetical protein